MSNLHIFLTAVLVIVVILYAIFAMFVGKGTISVVNRVMNSSIPMTLPQHEEFVRATNRGIKLAWRSQGWLMVVATIILVVLDSHIFVVPAMFCVCIAVLHFYRAWQVVV